MSKLLLPLLLLSAVFLSSGVQKSGPVIPFNDQDVFPIDDYVWSDCTGESIHITGSIHIDVHGVINNNRMNFVVHDNYAGLTGVGESSGRLYACSGVYNDSYNGNFSGSYTETGSSSIRLNTAGSQNNLVMTFNTHTTVNAQGVVTVNRYKDSFHCQ